MNHIAPELIWIGKYIYICFVQMTLKKQYINEKKLMLMQTYDKLC